MKKIAFIAYSPITAKALSPLIQKMQKSYQLDLFSFHKSCSDIWNSKTYSDISSVFSQQYDLLITGNDQESEFEKEAILLAKQKNILTISIIPNKFADSEFVSEADHIICLDEETKVDIIFKGVSPTKIHALGNPYYDGLKDYIGFYPTKPPYQVLFLADDPKKTREILYYLIDIKSRKENFIEQISIFLNPLKEDSTLQELIESEENIQILRHFNFDDLLDYNVILSSNPSFLKEASLIGKHIMLYKHSDKLYKDFGEAHLKENTFKISDFKSTENIISFISNILLEEKEGRD